MGKKYLETKKDTLESSILGVWKTAIEEGEAIKDAAQMIKKEVKLDESQIEEHLLEMSEEQFDNFIEDLDDDLLEGVEMILDETIDLNEKKPGLLGKIGGAIASRIPGTSAKRKRVIKKAATREKQRGAKAKKIATKRKEKSDYAKAKTTLKTKKKAGVFGAEFNPAEETKLDEKHDTHVDPKDRDELDKEADAKGGAETAKKMKKAKEPEPGQMAEASGDKEAYKKFFNAALKKFKVSSPAELKGDDKKKFYDYIDKNWDADNEKAEGAMSQVREFKIQSMKAALAKVWGMEEGKNPFAEHKGTKPHKHPHEEDEKEVVKDGKTETGKKAAVIDLKPKIKDQ